MVAAFAPRGLHPAWAMIAASHLLVGAVEVLHVLGVEVRGGDVRAPPKPPLTWDAVPLLGLKVPVDQQPCMSERLMLR